MIERFRNIYLQSVLDVPIAQKKVRLERAEELYETADVIKNPREKISTKLQCLSSAREETEARPGNVTFAQINQFNQLSDEQLLETKKKLEEKILNLKGEKNGQVQSV